MNEPTTAVQCPTCGAPPGYPCNAANSGEYLPRPHGDRRQPGPESGPGSDRWNETVGHALTEAFMRDDNVLDLDQAYALTEIVASVLATDMTWEWRVWWEKADATARCVDRDSAVQLAGSTGQVQSRAVGPWENA